MPEPRTQTDGNTCRRKRPNYRIAHPSFHLLRGNFVRQIDHTRQNPRIMHAAGPQFEPQLMIFPDAARQFIHFGLGHAVDDFRADSEARQAVHISPLAESPQFLERSCTSPVAALFSLSLASLRTCCPY